ncbi:YihY/virulence factor BrkB family protein [Candidatus Zixiibacteriota bacterium]
MAKKTTQRPSKPARAKAFRQSWGHYVIGLLRKIDKHHVFLLAGGLSFSLFSCIVPLLLIVFAALGNILEKIPITEEITNLVDRIVPYPEYAATIKEFLFSRVDEFRMHKTLAGVLGMVGILFASSGLFSSMRTVLNTIFGARPGGPIYMGKLRDLGLVALVLLYFLLSTTLLPAWGVFKELPRKIEFMSGIQVGFLLDYAVELGSFVVIFGVFFFIYYTIPQMKLPKRVVGVSALSAAFLWQLAEQLFGMYIAHAATLKRVYGAFTLLIVVALWIYYSSLVFIISAEIGQLYRERKRKLQMKT